MMTYAKVKTACLVTALTAFTLYLAGCTSPATLGLNNAQWQRLTPAQQKTYMKHYTSIQSNLKKQAKQAATIAAQSNNNSMILPDVDVTVIKGYAAFAPNFNYAAITPLHIHLKPGGCTSAILSAQNEKQSTTLWFCYIHKMIGIDPSFYNMNHAWGTAFIDVNPLWNLGYTYTHINTSGYARLNNASVYIKAASAIDLTPQTVDLTQLVTLDNPADQTHV
jgi:hypothetical protein